MAEKMDSRSLSSFKLSSKAEPWPLAALTYPLSRRASTIDYFYQTGRAIRIKVSIEMGNGTKIDSDGSK